MNSAFVGKLKDVSVGFWWPCWGPSNGHQRGIFIQSFKNLGKAFPRIFCIRNTAQTWFLVTFFEYSSYISQILNFLYWMVCIFILIGVTLKTRRICSPAIVLPQKRFFEQFWMNLSSPLTVSYVRRTSLSFLCMEQSTAFEVKGQLYTTGKVIQHLPYLFE